MTAVSSGPEQAAAGPGGSEVLDRVREFLVGHPTAGADRLAFLRARFDAGLARVDLPPGQGGLGADRDLQAVVEDELRAVGAPEHRPSDNPIGHGMAGPTLRAFGTDEQCRRWLRPLWTGEEAWCQLFSEPGAGSDLAGLATRAVREGDEWVVHGRKVWTSLADRARWALLVARTDPSVPKHRGLTYFVCDMHAAGVEVRPLRQITGETEFNEVVLDGVRIPDTDRVGEVGQGWAVAQGTLMNERVSYTSGTAPRHSGGIGALLAAWHDHPERRTAGLHDRVLSLWVQAEAARLTTARWEQELARGRPGPEGSAIKLEHARLNQEISQVELEVLGDAGLRYPDYSERAPEPVPWTEAAPGWRYLRSRANSIEGGTSEILRTVVGERVLGLPPEPRIDKDVPFSELPR
ncbi:acyl-CoA dehydrogenase family protein [Actinomycetospora sp. TBRC 11914]|uniref:acyl-CoA dehydrogenase family protein n=1 Tax=Actinomycetospora sp. TBRC 11914 TaxID=2729387 RepID=UPI00145E30CB|nr:acyl-CoA dehydrogenase family protein [Actinomycetospora sp. TBRC 11914]NMO91633.1 acyl-CoA dehydrogenase [Actinomycetospora sp. TBRC 11914]